MRIALLLFLAIACRASTAPDGIAVYIDVSGTWRTTWGDSPDFAAANFDDHSWQTVQTPLPPYSRHQEFPSPFRWFRRRVALPEMARNTRLAITVGSLEGAYEVYADGENAGRTGAFELAAMKVPRPITFEFEHGPGPTLEIAIRVWRPTQTFPTAWRPVDQGPWLLTTPSAIPRNAGINAITLARAKRFGDLTQPIVLFCIATPVLLIWLRERSRTALLWLFLYLVLVGLGRADLFVELHPWSQPFGHAQLLMRMVLMTIPAAVFALFVCAWTGTRWILWPVAIAAGLSALLSPYESGIRTYAPFWLIQLLTFAALVVHLARQRRDYAIVIGAALVIYSQTVSFGGEFPALPLAGLQFQTGGWFPFSMSPHTVSTACFAFAMALIEVRRLVGDRAEKLRLASELESARTVQQLLFPKPASGHIDAVYCPANEVGGDFWRALPAAGGGEIVVVGDVSGKGLRAAMMVSLLTGALRNRRSDSPADILAELNRVAISALHIGFVTAMVAHVKEGRATIANAGHPAPYLNGEEVALEGALPLGIDAEAVYTEREMAWGEQLTFVSDGVIEAENAHRELFGFERTREMSGVSAQQIADAARAWGQNDDITVVTVKRVAV